MSGLQGKLAVVTGGNRGIGRGIAEAMGRAGMLVALTARDAGAARTAAAEIGSGARGYGCDVRRPEQVAALFTAVAGDLGGVEVLVNKAGGGIVAPAPEIVREDWPC